MTTSTIMFWRTYQIKMDVHQNITNRAMVEGGMTELGRPIRSYMGVKAQ